MDNPLYNGSGKGSNPRNCHTPKFRKNYDGIKWMEKVVKKFVKDLPRRKK